MKTARAKARRYLPNIVDALAGIALGPDSEAGLHTNMLAAKEIGAIAGVIPPGTGVKWWEEAERLRDENAALRTELKHRQNFGATFQTAVQGFWRRRAK